MIRINLLAGERGKAKKKTTLDPGQQALIGGGLILALAAGGVGWRYLSLTRQSNQLNADIARENLEKTRPAAILQQVQRVEAQSKLAKDRGQLINSLRRDNTGPVHLLDEISSAVPDRLWLTGIKQADAHPKHPGG